MLVESIKEGNSGPPNGSFYLGWWWEYSQVKWIETLVFELNVMKILVDIWHTRQRGVGGERERAEESALSRGKNLDKRQWNEAPDYIGSTCEELTIAEGFSITKDRLAFDISLPLSWQGYIDNPMMLYWKHSVRLRVCLKMTLNSTV